MQQQIVKFEKFKFQAIRFGQPDVRAVNYNGSTVNPYRTIRWNSRERSYSK
jgi:hypothetical protein